jgi:hypothetical protein
MGLRARILALIRSERTMGLPPPTTGESYLNAFTNNYSRIRVCRRTPAAVACSCTCDQVV